MQENQFDMYDRYLIAIVENIYLVRSHNLFLQFCSGSGPAMDHQFTPPRSVSGQRPTPNKSNNVRRNLDSVGSPNKFVRVRAQVQNQSAISAMQTTASSIKPCCIFGSIYCKLCNKFICFECFHTHEVEHPVVLKRQLIKEFVCWICNQTESPTFCLHCSTLICSKCQISKHKYANLIEHPIIELDYLDNNTLSTPKQIIAREMISPTKEIRQKLGSQFFPFDQDTSVRVHGGANTSAIHYPHLLSGHGQQPSQFMSIQNHDQFIAGGGDNVNSAPVIVASCTALGLPVPESSWKPSNISAPGAQEGIEDANQHPVDIGDGSNESVIMELLSGVAEGCSPGVAVDGLGLPYSTYPQQQNQDQHNHQELQPQSISKEIFSEDVIEPLASSTQVRAVVGAQDISDCSSLQGCSPPGDGGDVNCVESDLFLTYPNGNAAADSGVKAECDIEENKVDLRKQDRHAITFCKPCNKPVRRFERHILSTTLPPHKSCNEIWDLKIEKEHIGEDEIAQKTWRQKVDNLMFRYNTYHQDKTGINCRKNGQEQPTGKYLCTFGCGKAVGLTYLARHRKKCKALVTAGIASNNSEVAPDEDNIPILGDHILNLFKKMRHDEVYTLITTDKSFKRMWIAYYPEHFDDDRVKNSQRKNLIQEMRILGRFFKENYTKDGERHTFRGLLLTLHPQRLIEAGIKSKDPKRLITGMKKMVMLELQHLKQEKSNMNKPKVHRIEIEEMYKHIDAFWAPNFIGTMYSRHVGTANRKDKMYENLLVQKNVPNDATVILHLDAIYRKLNPVLQVNINNVANGKSIKKEDYKFIQNLLCTYIVINSRRRGNEVASLRTEHYVAQKTIAASNTAAEPDIVQTMFSIRCIGKFGTENPIAVSEFVEKGLEFLQNVKEDWCDTSQFVFAQTGYNIEYRNPIRSTDAKRFTELQIGMHLNQTREYR